MAAIARGGLRRPRSPSEERLPSASASGSGGAGEEKETEENAGGETHG